MSNLESIGYFGDARRAERGAWLFEQIASTGSLVLRAVGGDRAGEIAAHRFLDCPEVTVEEIVRTLGERTGQRCAGRRVIMAQDTTEINFRGRDKARRGLGRGGDGVGLGFFIHGMIAIDAEDEAVIGLLDADIWTRAAGDDGEACRKRRKRKYAEKESKRWLETLRCAATRAAEATQLIGVADRESDIYALFARRPPEVDLVVRAAQDRALQDGGRLFAEPAAWPILTSYEVHVESRGVGDPGRTAKVVVRAGTVRLKRPRHGAEPDDPKWIELTLVEAREVAPPPGTKPLHWRLLTTLAVPNAAAAKEIVRIYRLRWRIEQTYRALKTDGMRLPDVQIQAAKRLFKLAAIALGASVRAIQLVDARNGGNRPATDVADPAILDAAEAIGPTLERNTARQKNPHPPRSLSWLSWIIARLGGWNCYYKPPGPKTMRNGWDRFAAMAAGFLLARPQPAAAAA